MLNRFFGKLICWFLSTTLWVLLARHLIAHFTFRVFGYTKFPLDKYFEIKGVFDLDPDAMYAFVAADVSSLSWKLTNIVASDKWGHSGLVVEENGHLVAVHMKGDGLNKWHLLELLKECDNFALMKMPMAPDKLAIAKARLKHITDKGDIPYDYKVHLPSDIITWLSKGNDLLPEMLVDMTLYCSELVFVIGIGLVDLPAFKMNYSYEIPVFEPDDVYAACFTVFEHKSVVV